MGFRLPARLVIAAMVLAGCSQVQRAASYVGGAQANRQTVAMED